MYDGPLSARVLEPNEIKVGEEFALGATIPLMPCFEVEGLGKKLMKGEPIRMYSIPARGTFVIGEMKLKGIIPWFKVEVSAEDSAKAQSKAKSKALVGWFNGSALVSIGVYRLEDQGDPIIMKVTDPVPKPAPEPSPLGGGEAKTESPKTVTESPKTTTGPGPEWAPGAEVAFEDEEGNVVVGEIAKIVKTDAWVDGVEGDEYIVALDDLTRLDDLKKGGTTDGQG